MARERYIYPAVFDCAADGISIEFPDLPGCRTSADTDTQALVLAQEALALHLYGMEKNGDAIPDPTPLGSIHLEPNQVMVLVEAWMPAVREEMRQNTGLGGWGGDSAEEPSRS